MKTKPLLILIALAAFTLASCSLLLPSGEAEPVSLTNSATASSGEATAELPVLQLVSQTPGPTKPSGMPTATQDARSIPQETETSPENTGTSAPTSTATPTQSATPILDLIVQEVSLIPLGQAAEVNADDQSLLWISDLEAGEIWGLYPQAQEEFYEIYHVGGAPADAHHAGDTLWWADAESGLLGQISTQDGAYTHWQLGEVAGFNAIALDSQGRLWAIQAQGSNLFRLDAAAGQLCTYQLPDGGISSDLVTAGGFIWLGDPLNERLLRLDMQDNRLDSWTLPAGSEPYGLALDPRGNLWYADSNLGVLSRLEPESGQLSRYSLPYGSQPVMLSVHDGSIWYSEQVQGSLGMLNLETASPNVTTLAQEQYSPRFDCAPIQPADSSILTIRVGYPEWSSTIYTNTVDADGWRVFQLPEGALPWGIAVTDQVWLVDAQRQVLVRFSLEP